MASPSLLPSPSSSAVAAAVSPLPSSSVSLSDNALLETETSSPKPILSEEAEKKLTELFASLLEFVNWARWGLAGAFAIMILATIGEGLAKSKSAKKAKKAVHKKPYITKATPSHSLRRRPPVEKIG